MSSAPFLGRVAFCRAFMNDLAFQEFTRPATRPEAATKPWPADSKFSTAGEGQPELHVTSMLPWAVSSVQ